VLQGRVVGVNPRTVGAWRGRFAEDGLKKLGSVKPERGRKPVIPESKIQEIVELTQNSRPEAQTHWSVRTMAARTGGVPVAELGRGW
jgi:transposase